MYKYLEHEADMGIYGEGETQEEAFEEGARAMFDLMVDIKEVKSQKSKVKIKVEAKNIPELFIEWLNELLAQSDLTGLIFGNFKIKKVKREKDKYTLLSFAFGEPLDPKRHKIKTEVKGATYSGLRCEEKNGRYYCQCVVDI